MTLAVSRSRSACKDCRELVLSAAYSSSLNARRAWHHWTKSRSDGDAQRLKVPSPLWERVRACPGLDPGVRGIPNLFLPMKQLYFLRQVSLLCLLVQLAACSQPQLMELHGSTMGTTYSIKLPRPPQNLDAAQTKAEIDALLGSINKEMSTYDPQSNLSRFNQAPPNQWQAVPNGLMSVLIAALDIHQLSDGAFDPTVGPLVNLWGFGPQGEVEFPSPQAVQEASRKIGYTRLELDIKGQRIRKRQTDMYVDLSAIAKGFAVDEVAKLLHNKGVLDYMVEIGGELRVAGRNLADSPWRIAVESPTPGQRKVHGILALEAASVATSGDYRNYFEHEGRRYSHSIDPRTGFPVTHNLVSVTVVDPSAMRADALATALLVLGAEKGLALANQQQLAVWFIIEKDGELTDLRSPAMDGYRVH